MARRTVLDLQSMKADNQKIVMVTAYDWNMARIVDTSGADMVLVGDSVGMVIQGHENTLSVTLDDMIYHARCVDRGLTQAHLTVDMPFMSYQISPAQALASAGRLVQEGHAQSVKLEGGERSAAAIKAIVEAGIPVVGHVGLTPQSIHAIGGYRVQGRSDEAAEQLVRDAVAVEEAGAFCIVLEMVPEDVASRVTQELGIPTVGIGAGAGCDGQVLVCNDLLGMNAAFKPRFVRRYAELEGVMVEAFKAWATDVREGTFPGAEQTFVRKRGPVAVHRIY